MKIQFLGTSSGWPLPRLGCNCEICTSANAKNTRFRPSLLVNDEVLIDANPDIYHELVKYNIDSTKLKNVILTHAHDDHIMGLYDLSHIYNNKQKVNLISSVGILSQVRKKMSVSMFSFKTITTKPFEKLQLENNTDIWLIPVKHTVETYAIKIKAPKPIVYAVEFRKILPSSQKFIGDLDLAIIDGSSKSKRGQAFGHETIEEGLKLGKRIHAKKIIFTNIGHMTDNHKNLTEFVKTEGNDKFNIAFDGLTIKM